MMNRSATRMVLVGLVGVGVSGLATTAAAQVPSNTPYRRFYVPDETPAFLALRGDTLYMSGSFRTLGLPTHPYTGFFDPLSADKVAEPLIPGMTYDATPDRRTGFLLSGWHRTGHAFTRRTPDGVVTPFTNLQGIGYRAASAGSTAFLVGRNVGSGQTFFARADLDSGEVLPWPSNGPTTDTHVSDLAAGTGRMFVAGGFDDAQGARSVVALDQATGAILPWRPSVVQNFVTGIAVHNGRVYTVGAAASSSSRLTILAFDEQSGQAVPGFSVAFEDPSGSSPLVHLKVLGGDLVAYGRFTRVAGASRSGVAILNPSSGSLRPFAAAFEAGVEVASVERLGDLLYCSGRFNQVGGQRRFGLAAFSAATGALDPWDPGLAPMSETGKVFAINGSILCAASSGVWKGYRSVDRFNIAAVDLATGSPTSLNPVLRQADGSQAYVESIALHDDRLYAVGNFATVSGVARRVLAGFDAETGELLSSFVPAIAGTDFWPGESYPLAHAGGVLTNLFPETGDYRSFSASGVLRWRRPIATSHRTTMSIGSGRIAFLPQFGAANTAIQTLDLATGNPVWSRSLPDINGPHLGVTTHIDGNRLYVGGSLQRVGNRATPGLAAFDLATNAQLPFSLGVRSNNINFPCTVLKIATTDQTIAVIGSGYFPDGVRFGDLAAFDATTGAALPWRPIAGTGARGSSIVMNRRWLAANIALSSSEDDPILAPAVFPVRFCRADLNNDGVLDNADYQIFVTRFTTGAQGDYNNDGFIDWADYDQYVTEYETGCDLAPPAN